MPTRGITPSSRPGGRPAEAEQLRAARDENIIGQPMVVSPPASQSARAAERLDPAAAGPAHRAARVWLALATVLVLLGSTVATFASLALARSDAQKSHREFATTGAQVAATLQLAIQHEQDLIVSARAFVVGNPHATEAQFLQWAHSVQTMHRYPELSGFGYAVVVPAADLARFEARGLAAPAGVVSPDGRFQIIPPGSRPFYCLVKLGQDRNALVGAPIGMDFCAARDVGPADLKARNSGHGVYLPITIGNTTSLSVSIPVYRSDEVPPTPTARRARFSGWIGMSFSPTVLFAAALEGHPGVAVSMRYEADSSDAAFSSGVATRGAQTVTTKLRSGWTVTTTDAAVSSGVFASSHAFAVLLVGVLLSLLLGALLYLLGTGRGRAMRLVQRRTGELRHMALHDTLTGLPNRALILDRAEQALARARRDGSGIGMMFLDLDEFKTINDTLGHARGDELLQAVSARLSGVLRATDTVGRLGGDEFVILVEGPSPDAGAELLAERIRAVLGEPFQLSGPEGLIVHTQASIGIALGIRSSADDLLRDADVALYRAKETGKDRFVLFAPEMQTAVQDRLQLKMDLRNSVGSDEFFLVYQPIFELDQVTLIGVEALLRWQHPGRGLVMPDTFIPVAEQTGLIVPLGRWVLNEACRWAAGWQHRGHMIGISVNVSASQLATGTIFLDTIREVLADTGLDPGLLTLEITESILMRDAVASARYLRALKGIGVRIAIDDFGTGYSSMAYLQQFPVDSLKIDRFFISGNASSPESSALIRTLVQLGKTLGIQTVAEGIETSAQLHQLQGENCDSGQGFLFSRPLSAIDLERYLELPSRVFATAERVTAS
jgi:diguanylate cyclase (GGDEF)-like protein